MINELNKLKETVLLDAQQYCDRIIEEKQQALLQLSKDTDDAIRLDENKTLDESRKKIEEKYKKETEKAKSDAFHRLLESRNAITNQLTLQLQQRLTQFTLSPQYGDFMRAKADAAMKIADGHTITAEVFNDGDEKLLNGIEAAVKSNSIPGGVVFKIPEIGVIIDNSFETALQTVMSDFHKIRLDNTVSGQVL